MYLLQSAYALAVETWVLSINEGLLPKEVKEKGTAHLSLNNCFGRGIRV
ncbi:MAG: hypothetical protein ACI8Q1_002322 [Parvicella sp.]|jgi:hypothetical protein